MPKILIVYYSKTGNTEKMAQEIAKGALSEDVDVTVKQVEQTDAKELLDYDGIIAGSPTYFGAPAWELKKLFDDSVRFYGQMIGKVGGAFTSSANIGGGNETTILSIIQMMLIHGMIVQGTTDGGHYGPVAIGSPDEKTLKECRNLGKRVAILVKKLKGEK
ncbi:MAG: flavodoxin domain-containing protein [Candidatus Omnitrophica bacterium]|nr:flavodoxin domain-containing protein [Candidatus Omnitrophota bacterium]MCM8816235.1 flavodoxin domain-containing protein [Candidatus Omnitrophota bacterium]